MDFGESDQNAYEDITVPVGCDLSWAFSLEPWDATGTSASFVVNGITFAMVITVTADGDDPVSAFAAHLTPAQCLTRLVLGFGNTVPYVVRWTDSLGKVWPLGYGIVLAA